MNLRKGAVFLDKDGTILANEPYNVDPDRMRFAPYASCALGRLGRIGVPLVVVSNQPGIALGRFAAADMQEVEERLETMFHDSGARLGGFYWCPHDPAGVVPEYSVRCLCRKPLSGLLARAASDKGIALRQSWMIGDILDDVEAGSRAGCRTILVDCGNETEWDIGPSKRALRTPHFVVPNLDVAAQIVVAHSNGPLNGLHAVPERRQ
jgi:D,D-heptose 1,7-bisphosphate phosphatase